MKIGDLVVRTYGLDDRIPGIITGTADANCRETGQRACAVAWSDNTTSEELDCELDYLKDILEAVDQDD